MLPPGFAATSSQYSGNEIRCRGKEPGNQFFAHPLPGAVSGAAAAPLGAVGGAIASAARI